MRSLEIIVLVIALLFAIAFISFRRLPRFLIGIATAVAMTVAILYLLLEGYRWQLLPALIALVILFIAHMMSIRTKEEKRVNGVINVFVFVIAILMITVSALLGFIIPVAQLTQPKGPFAIGTITLHLVDPDRTEIYGPDRGASRELMLQVWYPAEESESSSRAPYIQNIKIAGPFVARRLNLPPFLLDHLNLVRTHAIENAEPIDYKTKFPLLLFSHGLRGMRTQNTILFEHLASHGYIVASVDHTYDSVFSVFPDGRVITHDNATIFPANMTFLDASNILLDTRSEDLEFVLEQLIKQDRVPDFQLAGTIDFEKIGALGHSTGGGAALEYCAQNEECDAVLLLDGWLEALDDTILQSDISRAIMTLSTQEWLGDENKDIGINFLAVQSQPTYQLTITETNHYNYTDIPLLSPATPFLNLAGSIDPQKSVDMINDFTLAFFDKHLTGRSEPLQQLLESPPEEVLVE